MSVILFTALTAAVLAFLLGVTLGFFKNIFAVKENVIAVKIREILPGGNCGACGYPGCESYAEAIADNKAPANACTVGGSSVAEQIASITGSEAGAVLKTVVLIECQGTIHDTQFKGNYTGIKTCRGAKIAGGVKTCVWGCIGFGDCVRVCKFDALRVNENGLAEVDEEKCTGCGICIKECPIGLLVSVPREQKRVRVLCSNKNPLKQAAAKCCKIACIKCDLCVKNCPKQCIKMESFIPVIDSAKCDLCGTCVEKCPRKVLKIN